MAFKPESILNMRGLYKVLVNPANKKSTIDPDHVSVKHQWKWNSLKYYLDRWFEFISNPENDPNKNKDKK